MEWAAQGEMNRKAGVRAGSSGQECRGQGKEKLTENQGSGQAVVDRKEGNRAGSNGQKGRVKGRE